MDWLDRMNAAVDYIEQNLDGEIDTAEAARRACCSQYHFTRMFSFISGLTLSEYIRNRRLTLAGFALKHSRVKIISLAVKYGYESQGSFTRAFTSLNGVTPSEARKPGVTVKSFACISFFMTIQGGEEMEYRIVEEAPWKAFGKSMVTKLSEAFETVPAYWAKGEEERQAIIRAAGGNENTLVRSLLFDEGDDCLRYVRCLEAPQGGVPDDFEQYDIPGGTWAVFPRVIEPESGDGTIPVRKRIWTEWFPSSGYEQAPGPRQERNIWREDGKMIVEAWVPVVKSPCA